jgi:hypothetical protein
MSQELAETMGIFLRAALAARDAEFYAQAVQRKSYLLREVLERWRIGKAPTLAQCVAAGATEKNLRAAGLLCDPLRDGPDEKPYMFFRRSMVIPFFAIESTENTEKDKGNGADGRPLSADSGTNRTNRPIYFTSRRLVDHDPKTGEPLDKSKKALSMRMPDSRGWGGVKPPPCFWPWAFTTESTKNTEKGILVVEGPLDAIACCERGQMAVALCGTQVRAGLKELLQRFTGGTPVPLEAA